MKSKKISFLKGLKVLFLKHDAWFELLEDCSGGTYLVFCFKKPSDDTYLMGGINSLHAKAIQELMDDWKKYMKV